jgi:hypothetical protein
MLVLIVVKIEAAEEEQVVNSSHKCSEKDGYAADCGSADDG